VTDLPSPPDDSAEPPSGPGSGVAPVSISDELRKSYLDYAMSVIVSRALPDARDGLKPVHRRIIYSMFDIGMTPDRAYSKSARVVGDVLARFHPHGDASVYDALVRMAQPFSMGMVLVDGQGNFGSIDNDPPAQMRYTECRLTRAAMTLVANIREDAVDFVDNYDGKDKEPSVLPAQLPNLLANGAGGIAVGMATNIPPHNLGEVLDAAIAMIDDPAIDDAALLELVPGPDFPTGGLIIGRSGARAALLTGRGPVVMRGRTHVETVKGGREAIIVDEVPYQVNKAGLVEKIAELVREKRLEGVADLRDESDRHGVRVVIEVKRDASAEIVLNNLYRLTPLQSSFGVNMLALNGGRPELMTLRTALQAFLSFREEVVARRTRFELNRARNRAHVLVGLALAVANIDEIIRIIRHAPDPAAAREALLSRSWPAQDMGPLIGLIADRRTRMDEGGAIRLSDEQAQAILDLRLQRLTGLGRDEIGEEARGLSGAIQEHLDILGSRPRILAIIKDELRDIRERFAVPRRSEIVDAELDLEDEALIERAEMVVMVTHGGYVKRTPLDTYRTQHRGGRGRAGMDTKEQDFVVRLFAASTHAEVLFFSSSGMVYKQKVWRLPFGAPQSPGRALVNIFPMRAGERITSVVPLPESAEEREQLNILFATRSGDVRRNLLSDFLQVNRSGKIAMKLEAENDAIVDVRLCGPGDDVLLTTARAQCIRFPVADVRVFTGRTSTGVRGIRLAEDDEVIAMTVLRHAPASPAEARAYLRHASAMRRAAGDEVADPEADAALEEVDSDEADGDDALAGAGQLAEPAALSPQRIAELGAAEQFILTITEDGMGKRASSFDYRVTGRGGKGLIAHRFPDAGGRLAASFPVDDGDEIMLVTNAAQLIRCSVDQIRIAARATQGVRVLRVNPGERVVSVERLEYSAAEGADPGAGDA
jgi:DNA gyrase subunit A